MLKLREIREQKTNLTQRQAALALGLSSQVYGRYENGKREPPLELLRLFADFYGVSVDELTGREKQEEQVQAPKTPEARTLAAGIDRMPEEERKKALQMVKLMFDQADYFMEGDDDAT